MAPLRGALRERPMTSCDRGSARSMRAGSRFDAGLAGRGDLMGVDAKIAARARLTQQHESVGDFRLGQSERRAVGIVNLALQQAGPARAAIAALAAVRQIQGRVERRVEQRLIRRGAEAEIGIGKADTHAYS